MHIHLDGVVGDFFAPFAQVVDQLLLGNEAPGARQQHFEQAQLARRQIEHLVVDVGAAADSVEQRVEGLDLGADDYMAKPFALSELEARVRALTRRGAGGGAAVVRHGPLVYDQVGRSAYINDQMLDLSARELGLLEVLLARTGRLVSKEQLVDHLCEWGEEVSNNAIEVYVHRLRKKIEVGGVRIATVRGLGYCLEKFSEASAAAAAAAAANDARIATSAADK